MAEVLQTVVERHGEEEEKVLQDVGAFFKAAEDANMFLLRRKDSPDLTDSGEKKFIYENSPMVMDVRMVTEEGVLGDTAAFI